MSSCKMREFSLWPPTLDVYVYLKVLSTAHPILRDETNDAPAEPWPKQSMRLFSAESPTLVLTEILVSSFSLYQIL